MWFGYMFFNLKDIPYASLLICSYYYSLKIATSHAVGKIDYLKLGLTVSLLSVTKLIGVAMLGLFVLISLAVFALRPGPSRLALNRRLLSRAATGAAISFLGIAVAVPVFWPQIYLFTPAEAFEAVTRFINYDIWTGSVLINGINFNYLEIPAYYVVEYLLVSMPIFMIILLILWPTTILRQNCNSLVISSILIVTFAIFYQFATGATVYNGYRHFLFLIPFFMIVAAHAASQLLREHSPWIREGAAAALILGIFATAGAQYRLFPYQYSYYNLLVGGIKAAEGKYLHGRMAFGGHGILSSA